MLWFHRSGLFNNELSGTIPTIIGSLTNLQSLYESYPKTVRQEYRLTQVSLVCFASSLAICIPINSLELFQHSLDLSPIFNRCTSLSSRPTAPRLVASFARTTVSFINLLIALLQPPPLESVLGEHSNNHWVSHKSSTTVRYYSPTDSWYLLDSHCPTQLPTL